MTFDEWYNEQRNNCAFLKGHNGTISRKEIARMVWEYKQKEIDDLKKKITILRDEIDYWKHQ